MNRRFNFHGGFLVAVGILSVIYNPHTGLLGFNAEAKSGLIVGVAFAVISFFWAFIYSRHAQRVAVIGGFVTTLLLFAGTIPRAFGAWIAYARGDMTKWFAATTISLVILGTIPLFVSLLHSLRTKKGNGG